MPSDVLTQSLEKLGAALAELGRAALKTAQEMSQAFAKAFGYQHTEIQLEQSHWVQLVRVEETWKSLFGGAPQEHSYYSLRTPFGNINCCFPEAGFGHWWVERA